jgi:hypothetical protein
MLDTATLLGSGDKECIKKFCRNIMGNVHLEFREGWGIILRWILGRQVVRYGNE